MTALVSHATMTFASALGDASNPNNCTIIVPPASDAGTANHSDAIWLYFLSLMIIILVHRAVGTVAHKLGVPRIIGDIVAGCLLGPTVMGTQANQWLFPATSRPIVEMFGQWHSRFSKSAALMISYQVRDRITQRRVQCMLG